MKKKTKSLRITDTTLRDAHQSLWATRMKTEDIMGIIDVIDKVGYYSLEVWGGATFDVCLRFLYEDPWERLRLIKSKATKTPLQMLLRGQNVVGYKNYPDDVVDRFVALAHHNGIDIFRVFDALNDTRNLEAAIKAVKKYGAHAQGTLSYTISPVHTVSKYVQYAKEQAQLGIDSLCIKDMAGILSPQMATDLVSALQAEIDVPIQVHCHATSGMAVATYLEAARAGAGAIDTAVSSMAGFSSQPPAETMLAIFADTEFETQLDRDAIREINGYFTKLYPLRAKGRPYEPIIDSEIMVHQIPGGMISNFRSQLEQQDALDKLPEALDEVIRVREDLGFPPLVTPTSQIVGTQAVMNVLAGERYKMVPQEVKNYVKGMYGRSPAPISDEMAKKILGEEQPIGHRPADDLKPMLPGIAQNITPPQLVTSEEDILSYCLFPEVAMEFFKWRAMAPEKRPKSPADMEFEALGPKPNNGNAATNASPETLLHADDYVGLKAILEHASQMQLNEIVISKGEFNLSIRSAGSTNGNGNGFTKTHKPARSASETNAQPQTQPQQETAVGTVDAETIKAAMSGTFYRTPGEGKAPFVEEGTTVETGATIFILEAMKLFNEIQAPKKCRILKFLVENGTKVTKGQPLIAIEEVL